MRLFPGFQKQRKNKGTCLRGMLPRENLGFYVEKTGALIRPEGEEQVPVDTWVWSTASEHPRDIFPQSPPHNSKGNIPTFE